ncbi:MAG: hypothetical protein GY825_05535, partial [Phycisphaeraceae bacterium]|nr:hypothetical protein [Phycisphaeraceae bacterium]
RLLLDHVGVERIAPYGYTYTAWRKVQVFSVDLDCGHKVEVPFGRHPEEGKRMRCYQCREGDE